MNILKFKLIPLLILTLLFSCRATFKPEVKITNSKSPKSPTVLLLTSCHSSDNKCKNSFNNGVEGILKSELQFMGFKTIDSNTFVKDSKTRDETTGALSLFSQKVVSVKSKNQIGSIYQDLSPTERKTLLKEANATGIISTLINMFAKDNSKNWIVEVQIEYKTGEKNDIVWVTRCKHESFWNEKNSWSIEKATKCALKGLKDKVGKDLTVNRDLTIKKRAKKNFPIMLKIKSKIKISNDFRDGVEEVLTSSGYSLVDESVQEEALKEQAEQKKSDCYDDSCLIDAGKMIAAKALIIVEIEKKSKNSYKFKARFIDFETATTIKSVSKYYEFSLNNYKELMNFGKILSDSLL